MTQSQSLEIGGPAAGGTNIGLRSLGEGRLVLFIPKREQTGKKYKSEETQQQIVTDVVVLDGGPVRFGGKARIDGSMEEPDTMIVEPGMSGWFAPGAVIGSPSMLWHLRGALPDPMVGFPGRGVVGRLYKDPQYNNSWKIKDPTAEDIARAQRWLAESANGTFVNPQPRPIAGPQPQAAPVNYGYAPQQQPPAQAPYGPQGGYAAPVQPQAPAWPQQPSYAPQAATAAPIPQQYTPQGQAQYAQQPQPGYAPQPTAPVAPMPAPAGDDVPVPGFEAWWGGMTPEQKAQARAQFAGAAPTGY